MEKAFETEISYIRNPVIQDLAKRIVKIIPEYFYSVPASSSGKYHPQYALGDGGLYRHVMAAVRIAKILFQINSFTSDEQDLIITALIAHDGWKQGVDGSGGHTLHAHPVIAAEVISELVTTHNDLEKRYLEDICSNIESHMGQWNTNPYNKNDVVLPVPKTKMQEFVHMADYLASRKALSFDFSVPIV